MQYGQLDNINLIITITILHVHKTLSQCYKVSYDFAEVPNQPITMAEETKSSTLLTLQPNLPLSQSMYLH
jgi:hypothetical protein